MSAKMHPETNTKEDLLEQLRCSLCTGYLSCAPIQVLPNGNSVCGRCSFANNEEHTYRNLMLETALSRTLFPCQYKKHGCQERLLFDHINEHESKCEYYSIVCPFILKGMCVWEGSALEILDHFKEKHILSVLKNAHFNLHVNEHKEDIFLVVVENVSFVIRYRYNGYTSNLSYSVQYFTYKVQNAIFTITLINQIDRAYTVTSKGDKCRLYATENLQKWETLTLNNYVPVLNCPNYVTVALNITVTKPDSNAGDKRQLVDYDLLQTLSCAKCYGYLVPPLFDCKKGIVCSNCYKKFSDSKPTRSTVKDFVMMANFPCHWRDCEFVGKIDNYKEHIRSCPKRIYECINTNACKNIFKREEALAHLQSEGHVYFSETFIYKIVFEKVYAPKYIFAFKNEELVSFTHETLKVDQEVWHRLALNVAVSNLNRYTLQIQFEHQHCKIKSKRYSLDFCNSSDADAKLTAPCNFNMDDLPHCFKLTDELTVSLTLL